VVLLKVDIIELVVVAIVKVVSRSFIGSKAFMIFPRFSPAMEDPDHIGRVGLYKRIIVA
jgi:hypothetical protein